MIHIDKKVVVSLCVFRAASTDDTAQIPASRIPWLPFMDIRFLLILPAFFTKNSFGANDLKDLTTNQISGFHFQMGKA
jgi:hypothetical protein